MASELLKRTLGDFYIGNPGCCLFLWPRDKSCVDISSHTSSPEIVATPSLREAQIAATLQSSVPSKMALNRFGLGVRFFMAGACERRYW